jgi:hypothetical protein
MDLRAGCAKQVDGRGVDVRGDGHQDARRRLDHDTGSFQEGLDPTDAGPDHVAARQGLTQGLHVLDPVQQRHRRVDGCLHAPECSFERRRLHGDEQDVGRLAQLRRHARPRGPDLLALSQGQSLGPDQLGRVWTGDADNVDTGIDQADREHPTDGAGPEDGDGHVRAGSAIRLTYFHSL